MSLINEFVGLNEQERRKVVSEAFNKGMDDFNENIKGVYHEKEETGRRGIGRGISGRSEEGKEETCSCR